MKKLMFLAASAAMMLASCTEKMDFTQADLQNAANTSNEVQFGTYMGRTATTRAGYEKGPIDNSTTDQGLKNAQFGVFGYLTTEDYSPSTPTSQTPNFMFDQQITWDGTNNLWTYDPVKYWPNGIDAANSTSPSNTATQKTIQKLSFFAYAPFKAMSTFNTAYVQTTHGDKPSAIGDGTSNDDKVKINTSVTNGISAMTTNDWTGNVWVKFLMPKAQEDEAVDLLWGLRGSASYAETDNTASTGTIGTDYNINLTKQHVPGKVSFLFKHALTKIGGQTYETEDNTIAADGDKIGFKIVADVDVNTETTAGDHDDQATYFGTSKDFNKSKTLITLKSIKIQDGKSASDDAETAVTGVTASGIANSGWFNIETGTWAKQTSSDEGSKISIVAKSDVSNQSSTGDENYSINPEIREAASYSKSDGSGDKKLVADGTTWATGNPTGIYTTAVPVFAKETIPGVTLIPGGSNQDIYITVDYLVRTADPNLTNGFSQVEQVISNKVSLSSLEPNKYYTIIIHLGMTSVKFEAVVADWQTTDNGTYNNNGTFTPAGGSNANEKHIWLPSNVVTTP